VIYFLIVYHLTEQINFLIRIFFECFVAYFYRIFYAIAKAKMSCEIELNRAEVEVCGREVLFAKVFLSSCFFDLTGNGRSVVGGYFELFYSGFILISSATKVSVCSAWLAEDFLLNKKPRLCGALFMLL
jgi:hypothetical protein